MKCLLSRTDFLDESWLLVLHHLYRLSCSGFHVSVRKAHGADSTSTGRLDPPLQLLFSGSHTEKQETVQHLYNIKYKTLSF